MRPTLHDCNRTFERPMFWRMKHRQQRAYRAGDWKYLKVDENEYLFDLGRDERERANQARRDPGRLDAMRSAWERWNAGMPAVPAEAVVHQPYGLRDMPAR
jgi:hypothetical protein